ncbi:ammonia-forming cytochrome c nitrite reductase subunit c552, partial [Sphingobacteriales bacterium CHB3]|nr:ammonia-forming cytochrome c nitrite reductase subunit c552 [Sphingobacteriales bacterium CHB3]
MNTRTKRWLTFGGSILVTILVAALLINIFERQQEGRVTYMKIVEISPGDPDPEVWKVNFP